MAKYLQNIPISSHMYNCHVLPNPDSYTFLCKKKTDWCLRGLVESLFCDSLVFITLTYDNDFLPRTYKKVSQLPCFSQRYTRRKVSTDTTKKWVTVKSKPVNTSLNHYRTKDICTEQDFKNAKFRFKEYCNENNKTYKDGLLIPQHLKDFLTCLRNDIRNTLNNDFFHLRYIANGEYGQNTHRPHYHIVIFNHLKYKYDYYSFVRTYWLFGRIIQVKEVQKNDAAIKKLTSYICGHTVKCDSGNVFQNEFSKPFSLTSTFNGGIGSQLINSDFDSSDSFFRSLRFSLSEWDKKAIIKYKIVSDKSVFEYPFPRYYLKKILGIEKLSDRHFFESQFRSVQNLVRRFCVFAKFFGTFDLLPILSELGLYANPRTLLTYFVLFHKNLANKFTDIEEISNFVAKFFSKLDADDDAKKKRYKVMYSRRKQSQKYQDYLQKNNLTQDLT